MKTPAAVGIRHRVVIVGAGFGGLYAAKRLARADVDVTVIAKTTHHLFQPLLYQVATGILSEGEIAVPMRLILRHQRNVRVLLGEVVDVDLHERGVTSRLLGQDTVTPFDSLIVATGVQQSYFGHDEFATYAPGMKTIDDALELRGRILGAFELAELASTPAERARLMTFVVVGAGATGVELAGQIAELARRTLGNAFRSIEPGQARVVLLDAAPAVLPGYGPKLGATARRTLERVGIEVRLDTMVQDVDADGVTVREPDGSTARIESACKIWSAGVQAGPLGALLAERSDGSTVDRAGRVVVEPDLTVKGHPNVFVVGDLMSLPGVPGQCPAAIQSGIYAARQIMAGLAGRTPDQRKPFAYFDKGSMATVSRFNAVARVGRVEFSGVLAWLTWLVLHLYYLVGHRNRLVAVISWLVAFLGRGRGQLAATQQQVFARTALQRAAEAEQPASRAA